MKKELDHKLYMGFCGFKVPIPPLLSEIGAKRSATGTRAHASRLSELERRVYHFIVMKMAVVKEPITTEFIANELEEPNDQVLEIINRLENLKTFIYRGDGKGINWAYPFSLENTGHRVTASSGEQFFAA